MQCAFAPIHGVSMSQPNQAYSANLLIQAMSPEELALLEPKFERVDLEVEQVLDDADQAIEYIYFPEGGIVSLVASGPDTNRTEVGIFGRDGVSGTAALLGTDRASTETFVQVDGTTALRVHVDDYRAAIEASPSLNALLLRYVQAALAQSVYSTMSNAHHNIEARLARWLLMCHDRLDSDDIKLTHEFMSMMVAAQRSGVTVCLHILEGNGMIRSKRSLVTILDREKLIDLAGDAYGKPEAEYRRLIGPFGRPFS